MVNRVEASQQDEIAELRRRLAQAEALRDSAVAALHQSEARFRAFMDNSPCVAFLKDAEGRMVYGNVPLGGLLSCSPAALPGKTDFELFPAEVARRLRANDATVMASGRVMETVEVVPNADGVMRTWLVMKFPVPDESQGRLLGGVAVDITERQQAEEALRHSEERFRQVAENIQEVIWMTDKRSKQVLYVSPAYERVWGHSCQSLYERPRSFLDAIHPQDRERVQAIADAQDRRQRIDCEYRIVRPDGSVRWIHDQAFPIHDEHGEVYRVVGIAEDITDRKRTEEALRRSEAEFRAMFELAGVGKGQADPLTCRFLRVNRKMCAITGYTADEMLGMTFSQLTHPEDRAGDAAGFQRLVRGETREYAVEKRYIRKDGSIVWVHVTCTILRDGEGRPLQSVAVIQDITARRQAEEKLHDYAGRLRDLSRRLLDVQEQERRYFARELHDEVGQALTGLDLALETVARLPTEQLRDGLTRAQALAKETIAQVRELSMRLRPTMLDDLGLRPALLWHFKRYSTQTGVQVDFHVTGLDSRLPTEVETAAYRILQEALTNVARHAGVGAVAVRVRHEDGELFLAVEDKGMGFDAAAVRGTSGLSGMYERVTLLGGQLTIESQPGAGTRLIATLPCSK
jgi:two-component system, sensor histidine kinase and response regulator